MKWKSSLLAIFSRVVRQMVTETHENDDYYDVTFVIIVFISFLPSIFMPWFFVHWILIGQIKTKGIRNILFHSVKGRNGNGANSQTGVHHSNTRKYKGKSKRRHLKILLKMIFAQPFTLLVSATIITQLKLKRIWKTLNILRSVKY